MLRSRRVLPFCGLLLQAACRSPMAEGGAVAQAQWASLEPDLGVLLQDLRA